MEKTLFKFIWRYSKRDQIILLVMTALSFPFLYFSLDLPKIIINKAISGKNIPSEIFGVPIDQIEYLLVLSLAFLLLVCINGGFKFYVNVFRGQLGERMLRRLRFDLLARVLRFPLPQFRRVSQGEVIQMVTAEVEPLGGFVGDSVALPAFQGGTLITILIFMFVQDWMLGLAAIALYPIQGYIIPKLQWHVNQLGKARVQNVRRLSEKIGESVSGIEELHANDGARRVLATFTERLGTIYDIRYEIFQRKFFIKFVNNFIAQLTPFFFYSIGGYLVIKGDLTFGALVAILAAYKDLSAPWKELLTYYQRLADSKIKYDQVIEQFDPPGILPENAQFAELEADFSLAGTISANNLSVLDDEGQPVIESLSFQSEKSEQVAIVGPSSGGKDLAAILLARLLIPDGGQIKVADKMTLELPQAATGRRMAYVGPSAFVFNSSLKENILLGAMHQPMEVGAEEDLSSEEKKRNFRNAELSGNSLDDLEANWLDYKAIGSDSDSGLREKLLDLLKIVDLDDDTYALGLRGTINPLENKELAENILSARKALQERLKQPEISEAVELFDKEKFNNNASVAENLLFGTPVGDNFVIEKIAENEYVRETLRLVELENEFVRVGRDVASTMVELFADLPSDHEYFSQYSFIAGDDLPDFQILLGRAERLGLDSMEQEDRDRFLALPFMLIPARHRLGLITDEIKARILKARQEFASNIPDSLRGSIEFYSEEKYNGSASLQDNILFGKIASDKAESSEQVGNLISEVIESENIRPIVVEVGLGFQVGLAGSKLSAAQRQKVSLARALIRSPDVLILNEATSALDSGSQSKVIKNIMEATKGKNLLWVLQRVGLADVFDRVLVMSGGRVIETGSFKELESQPDSTLNNLLRDE
ncbi:MAG: ABC transporter ATP-binding protein/permease [Alphaproteobacteria bacterium]|nr:ABC transporter ATP-binding protein/permease [Alphaproteobacteria bacterium]MDG1886627.1 ABC transporter ATP-binding protein/permease [Alphaproteobacteria bacterium]